MIDPILNTVEPTSASQPEVRRFNVIDSMVLTVAFALSLWPARRGLNDLTILFDTLRWPHSLKLNQWNTALQTQRLEWFALGTIVVDLILMLLLFLTPALLLLRLRQPRPDSTELVCLPGTLTMLAASGAIVASFLLLRRLVHPSNVHVIVSFAVVVAWGVHLKTGRWNVEPTWIDRAGRALGGMWISVSVLWYVVLAFWFGSLSVWPELLSFRP